MEQRLKGKNKIWIFITVWIIILGASYFLMERDYQKISKKTGNISNNAEDDQENRISSIDDISPEAMKMMQKYTMEDYEAKIAQKAVVTVNTEINGVHLELDRYMGGLDHYDVSNPKLYGFYLYKSKSKNDNGKLLILYTSDLYVLFKDGVEFNETLYTPYVYQIDLSNKDMPLTDYSKYSERIATETDYDYDNWYLKNITSQKDEWDVEEKIMNGK
ncbi:MAG: hypothetical protein K6B72_13300 [Lachnospiraceae bacterium]|nr:hypothetical protein [Lachnospiraceae bacterium]